MALRFAYFSPGNLILFDAIFFIFAFPSALVVGIAAFFLLRRFEVLNVWSICVIAAFIVGGIIDDQRFTPWLALLDITAGFISGLAAFLVLPRSKWPLKRDAGQASWSAAGSKHSFSKTEAKTIRKDAMKELPREIKHVRDDHLLEIPAGLFMPCRPDPSSALTFCAPRMNWLPSEQFFR